MTTVQAGQRVAGAATAAGGGSSRPRPDVVTVLTVAVVAAGIGLRLLVALAYRGVVFPDETYQMTEPAHRLVFGYGMASWEFRVGTRSWLGPGLLLPPTLLWRGLGLDGEAGTGLLRAWVAVGAGLTAGAAALLARRLVGPAAGLLAAALVAFDPVAVVYGAHPLADTVAALPVVTGVALLTVRRRVPVAAATAGALLVAAFVLRPHLLPLVLAVAVAVLFGAGRARARPLAIGAGGALIASGVLDAVTWGVPFAPLWRSVDFNVVDDGASRFGESPWSSYLTWTAGVAGPVVVVLLVVGLLLACRRPGPGSTPPDPVVPGVLVAGLVAFVVVLSAIGHKELRFVVPALPLAGALAAVGLARGAAALLRSRGPVRAGAVGGALAAAATTAGLLVLPGVTTQEFGYAMRLPALRLDDATPRMLSAAGRLPDVCGVVVLTQRLTWSGGYTALHRDVPLAAVSLRHQGAADWPQWANVVVAPAGAPLPPGYRPVVARSDHVVARRPGGCDPPPLDVSRRWI